MFTTKKLQYNQREIYSRKLIPSSRSDIIQLVQVSTFNSISLINATILHANFIFYWEKWKVANVKENKRFYNSQNILLVFLAFQLLYLISTSIDSPILLFSLPLHSKILTLILFFLLHFLCVDSSSQRVTTFIF